MISAAVWTAAGRLWFGLYAPKRMVLAPEERFAIEALDKLARRVGGEKLSP